MSSAAPATTPRRWTRERLGLLGGLALFLLLLALPAPAGMPAEAWRTAALIVLMAAWWMSQALPLTATALLPFVALPLIGVMDSAEAAAAYYSPIMFLVLGGAMLALAVERTGLHRRLALAIVSRSSGSPTSLLFGFMAATAIVSLVVSNTATALIMMPMAVAVIRAAGIGEGEQNGFAGALVLGVAYAASIGGLGTLVGSPTNPIAVGIIERITSVKIDFFIWSAFGLPLVAVAVPLAGMILMKTHRIDSTAFDGARARSGIGVVGKLGTAEARLLPILALTVAGWVALPLVAPLLPKGSLTDGTIAVVGALLLFIVPDGSGRPLLVWREANRAPWDVITMFGGGLALAEGISRSGLAEWLGGALGPLQSISPLVIALALVALVVLVTEFTSNVAAASAIVPVVGSLILGITVDPLLLAVPAALAASWGFMLPSGTGPNAIAWATGHVALGRMLRAGLLIDLAGIPLIVGIVWLVAAMLG